MTDELTKLRSPGLRIARFRDDVQTLTIEEIKESILLEMREVNRLFGVENKLEKMEDGLPEKNTPARDSYNDLTMLSSLFGQSSKESGNGFAADCRKILDKLNVKVF